MKKLLSTMVLCAVASHGLAACGGGDDEAPAEAVDAIDSAEGASSESSLAVVATASVTGATGVVAASQAAAAVGTYLQPPGCATAVANGATVTYTLRNCSGPAGLAQASGTFTATFSPAAGGATAALRGTLTFRRGTLDLNATVTGTASGTTRTLTVASNSTGTGNGGRSIARAGTFTAVYDGSCVALDGAYSTTVGAVTWNTTVTGYRRCAAACPTGSASFATNTGRAVTVSYTGSASATVTTASGAHAVTLACGA